MTDVICIPTVNACCAAASSSGIAPRVEFRNNHVFGTVHSITNNDGSAFNADSGNTGGIYEHNLSHDNQGGFMMWCGCWGMTTDITVRYNVSLNDGKSMEVQKNWKDPSQGMVHQPARVNLFYGQTDSRLYNNTYLLPVDEVDIAFTDFWLDDNSINANNVFLAQPGTTVSESVSEMPESNVTWRNNVYGGTAEGWPTLGADQNTVLPDLALLDGVGLDRLKFTGEQFAATGYPIADAGETDMLGNPVPSTTAPDLGAWQFTEFNDAPTLADGGFEAADSWRFNGEVDRVGDGARNGSAALRVGDGGSATATAVAAINRTYRLVAAVKADGGAAPSVQVELPGAFVVDAVASGEADADGWQPVTAVFRTAWDASDFTIRISGDGGSGLVDDVTVEAVEDLVVDGAFEALLNNPWQPVSPVEGTPATSWKPGDVQGGAAYSFERSEDAVTGLYATPVPVRGALGGWPAAPAENRFTFVTPGVDYELGVWAKTTADEVSLVWFSEGGESGEVATTSTAYTRLAVPLNSSSEQVTVGCHGEGLCDDVTLVEAFVGDVPTAVAPEAPVDPEPTTSPEPTQSPDPSQSPDPTSTPTAEPTDPWAPSTDLYSTPGLHNVNGRQWMTTCEPYSQTVRCTTDIWATQTVLEGGAFVSRTGWYFNNLTYLPMLTREAWGSNPLANTGEWTSTEGRRWKTECDTPASGGNGCRSWIWSSHVSASQGSDGAWSYAQEQGWVVNNLVRFR